MKVCMQDGLNVHIRFFHKPPRRGGSHHNNGVDAYKKGKFDPITIAAIAQSQPDNDPRGYTLCEISKYLDHLKSPFVFLSNAKVVCDSRDQFEKSIGRKKVLAKLLKQQFRFQGRKGLTKEQRRLIWEQYFKYCHV